MLVANNLKMKDFINKGKITNVIDDNDAFIISYTGLSIILFKKHNVTPKIGDELSVTSLNYTFGKTLSMSLNNSKIF